MVVEVARHGNLACGVHSNVSEHATHTGRALARDGVGVAARGDEATSAALHGQSCRGSRGGAGASQVNSL